MGTSINQASPNTPGWKAVARCYTDAQIPINQTSAEIWRAAVTESPSLKQQLSSAVVEKCLEIASRRPSKDQALSEVKRLNQLKENSIIGELAKRAVIASSVGNFRESPAAALFRQLTDYFVSRDIPGYVGERFRCKNISDLRAFKSALARSVVEKVSRIETATSQQNPTWAQKLSAIVEGLKRP